MAKRLKNVVWLKLITNDDFIGVSDLRWEKRVYVSDFGSPNGRQKSS